MKNKRYKDPRLNRLRLEQNLLEELSQRSDIIDCHPLGQRPGFPPDTYQVTYHVKSIIGINEDQSPVFGNKHVASIFLPSDFPMMSSPRCYMKTDVWHPNIRYAGEFKGRICINSPALGHWQTLDMLVQQIGEMLQYKNYHAENISPFPEDMKVAKWVLEYAEPHGIVNKEQSVFIDNRPLLQPEKEWLESRKKKSTVKVLGRHTARQN